MTVDSNVALEIPDAPERSPMQFADRVLMCVDCNTEFIFAAGEQLFFPRETIHERPKALQGL